MTMQEEVLDAITKLLDEAGVQRTDANVKDMGTVRDTGPQLSLTRRIEILIQAERDAVHRLTPTLEAMREACAKHLDDMAAYRDKCRNGSRLLQDPDGSRARRELEFLVISKEDRERAETIRKLPLVPVSPPA